MSVTADDAKARVLNTIRENIRNLETALADGRTGFIYFWPEHCLSVRILTQGQIVCGADRASIVKRNDPRTFTNGARQAAVLIDRRDALQRSLDHSRKLLAVFEAGKIAA